MTFRCISLLRSISEETEVGCEGMIEVMPNSSNFSISDKCHRSILASKFWTKLLPSLSWHLLIASSLTYSPYVMFHSDQLILFNPPEVFSKNLSETNNNQVSVGYIHIFCIHTQSLGKALELCCSGSKNEQYGLIEK